MNGQVQFHAKGLGMEKLLNEARKQGISFSRVKREKSRSLLLRCSPKDYAAFRALAEEKAMRSARPSPWASCGWKSGWEKESVYGPGR